MLFMRLTTTKTLTLKQENAIQKSVQKLLSEKDIMIHIEDNQVMYSSSLDYLHIECQMSQNQNLNEVIDVLKSEIEIITNIPIENQKMFVSIGYFYL